MELYPVRYVDEISISFGGRLEIWEIVTSSKEFVKFDTSLLTPSTYVQKTSNFISDSVTYMLDCNNQRVLMPDLITDPNPSTGIILNGGENEVSRVMISMNRNYTFFSLLLHLDSRYNYTVGIYNHEILISEHNSYEMGTFKVYPNVMGDNIVVSCECPMNFTYADAFEFDMTSSFISNSSQYFVDCNNDLIPTLALYSTETRARRASFSYGSEATRSSTLSA